MEGQINKAFSQSSEIELTEIKLNGDNDLKIPENEKQTNRFKMILNNNLVRFKLYLINIIFIAYFIWATYYYVMFEADTKSIGWESGYGFLIIIYAIGYLIFITKYINKLFYCIKNKCFQQNCISNCNLREEKQIRYVLIIITIGILVAFLIYDTISDRQRLISLIGLVAFLAIGWIFSKHPTQVNWRPVITGLILQIVIGLFTIRLTIGRQIFKIIGDKATIFLNFTHSGTLFLYGEAIVDGFAEYPSAFAFATLPVIYFVSFCVNILYYYGIMQAIVAKLGWFLGIIMGTTICESVNAASNIFLGMSESPLLLRPYLQNLTVSEMFAVMTSGFASVAGTVLAAYISFGANASHLITASVMSAPAALCFSKLIYPEVEKSQSTLEDVKNIKFEEDNSTTSAIDAGTKGANNGTEIILGITANLIAFISFVAFLNAIVNWMGVLVGYQDITFEYLMGKIFMPISWMMGVTWDECGYVGDLIALKTVVNEFAAYKKLGEFKNQKLLNPRSEMIATYAICGFSNPGSVGIMVGTMSTLVPHARHTITKISLLTFASGAIVCFMTACVAGLLVNGDEFVN